MRCEFARMTAVCRPDDVDIAERAEGLRNDAGHPVDRRRRLRIDDEQRGHRRRVRRYCVRVSAIGSQPRAVRIAALIGAAQGIALATYALALVSFEARSTTTGIKGSDLAPGVLVALYLVFALLVFGVTYWFATGRAAARTGQEVRALMALHRRCGERSGVSGAVGPRRRGHARDRR